MIMMSRETTRMTSEIGKRGGDTKRNVNRNDQRLVGQRIDVGAEFARHMEALGEKAVDGVADAGGQKQKKSNAHLAGRDRPDHDRH